MVKLTKSIYATTVLEYYLYIQCGKKLIFKKYAHDALKLKQPIYFKVHFD